MSQKKYKSVLRLDPDEIAIVGSRDQWEHLVLTYTMLAEDALDEDKHYWFEAASWISEALYNDQLERVDLKQYGDDE